MLATAGVDKMVRLRDLVSGKLFKPLRGHDYEIFSIAFSPNGKVLATGGRDKTVRLWSTATGELLGEPLRGHEDWIYSVSFSPDGNTLATASGDKTVRLWDIVSRKPIASLSGHEMEVKSVAFSPDGRTLVSGSMDKTVRMWAIGPTELAITDWRAQATKDEARYGLKLEGVNLVPWSQSLAGAKP